MTGREFSWPVFFVAVQASKADLPQHSHSQAAPQSFTVD
jgi:hypothetical protein